MKGHDDWLAFTLAAAIARDPKKWKLRMQQIRLLHDLLELLTVRQTKRRLHASVKLIPGMRSREKPTQLADASPGRGQ